MSQNSTQDHVGGLLFGVIYAVVAALLGYGLGYVLLLLAGQNLIIANVGGLTSVSTTVQNIVTAQYAGASILPYLFAFLFAIMGLAYGYLRHR